MADEIQNRPLEVAVPLLTEEVRAFRVETEVQNVKRDERIRSQRRLTFFALAAAAIGIVAGIIGIAAAFTANDKLDQANELRADRTRGSCIQYNVKQNDDRDAIKQSLLALVNPATPLTTEQLLRIQDYNDSVDEHLAYRDCTPEGIAKYLERPPADPATVPTTTT